MQARKPIYEVPISVAKNELLALIRKVEKGQRVHISKSGKVVALLIPTNAAEKDFLTGFAPCNIVGDIETSLSIDWSNDRKNF